jgi:hypothetical protein
VRGAAWRRRAGGYSCGVRAGRRWVGWQAGSAGKSGVLQCRGRRGPSLCPRARKSPGLPTRAAPHGARPPRQRHGAGFRHRCEIRGFEVAPATAPVRAPSRPQISWFANTGSTARRPAPGSLNLSPDGGGQRADGPAVADAVANAGDLPQAWHRGATSALRSHKSPGLPTRAAPHGARPPRQRHGGRAVPGALANQGFCSAAGDRSRPSPGLPTRAAPHGARLPRQRHAVPGRQGQAEASRASRAGGGGGGRRGR